MNKIRVYELARELKMQNKELLNRISSLGIIATNHMSTLTPDEVDRIKQSLQGASSDEVVQQRIKPTVIRRRSSRRVEAAQQAAEPPQAAAQVEAAAAAEAPAAEAPVAPPEMVAAATPAGEQEGVPIAASPADLAGIEAPEAREEEPAERELEAAPVRRPVQLVEPGVAEGADAQTGDVQQPPVGAERVAASARQAGAQPRRVTVRGVKPGEPLPPENRRAAADIIPISKQQKGPVPAVVPAVGEKRAVGAVPLVLPKEGEKEREGERVRHKPKKLIYERQTGDFTRRALAEQEDLGRAARARRKKAKPRRAPEKTRITMPKAIKRVIKVQGTIQAGELARQMGVKVAEVIKKLIGLGMMVTATQSLDLDTASLIAAEFNYKVEDVSFELSQFVKQVVVSNTKLETRAPVVTVMGHVDHGKTTLLDAIRDTRVADKEAGGITQHIGAYRVGSSKGDITFLDTPGHEAFTAIRARGAKVTDIVVLVVAADDGVMPQTVEAINHARAAEVPIVVAVNKIDKADAQSERVRRDLTEHELVPEEWGGETLFVDVSAKEATGIDELLDAIHLQAELLELGSSKSKPAEGFVIESRLEKGRGPMATVLVRDGRLKRGDYVVAGANFGRIRALLNDKGKTVEEAGPSTPVEVLGLNGVPTAGEPILIAKSEKDAKMITAHVVAKQREQDMARAARPSLEELLERLGASEVKELRLIVKADTQGSVEGLKQALSKLSNDEVQTKVIHDAVGGITETDINLASASEAIVIGFNVRPAPGAKTLADQQGVQIMLHSVIYDVVDEIDALVQQQVAPTFEEVIYGRAEVRETFHVPKVGTVAGAAVLDGKMVRGSQVRLLRDDVLVHDGRIASLRRFKEDVKEVPQGFECGIGLERFNDIKISDILESYGLEETSSAGG